MIEPINPIIGASVLCFATFGLVLFVSMIFWVVYDNIKNSQMKGKKNDSKFK